MKARYIGRGETSAILRVIMTPVSWRRCWYGALLSLFQNRRMSECAKIRRAGPPVLPARLFVGASRQRVGEWGMLNHVAVT